MSPLHIALLLALRSVEPYGLPVDTLLVKVRTAGHRAATVPTVETALRDQHIKPLIRNKMAMYGDAYIRKISESSKLRQLFKAQGWKNDATEFVLGDKLYKQGEIVHAGFSHGTEQFLRPFSTRGSLSTWRMLTESMGFNPQFAPHAFMLLLAFAAPLLDLAGRQGFTVCALGDTGAGKSTVARWMSSVYGHPDTAWIGRRDGDPGDECDFQQGGVDEHQRARCACGCRARVRH
jgi:hypothetical protein